MLPKSYNVRRNNAPKGLEPKIRQVVYNKNHLKTTIIINRSEIGRDGRQWYAQKQSKQGPGVCIITSTLRSLVHNNESEKAERLFREMKEMALATSQVYQIMLGHYYKHKDFKKIGEMERDVVVFDDVDLNNFLLRIFLATEKEKAERLFTKMSLTKCDHITYHLMIFHLISLSPPPISTSQLNNTAIKKLSMEEMAVEGQALARLYSILLEIKKQPKYWGKSNIQRIFYHFVDHSYAKSLEAFEAIPTKSTQCYFTIIRYFIVVSEFVQAWRLFYEMKQQNLNFDISCYHFLLNDIAKKNDWEEFEKWWMQLETEEFNPDTDCWNSRLLCARQTQSPAFAIMEYQRMVAVGVPPNPNTFKYLPEISEEYDENDYDDDDHRHYPRNNDRVGGDVGGKFGGGNVRGRSFGNEGERKSSTLVEGIRPSVEFEEKGSFEDVRKRYDRQNRELDHLKNSPFARV